MSITQVEIGIFPHGLDAAGPECFAPVQSDIEPVSETDTQLIRQMDRRLSVARIDRWRSCRGSRTFPVLSSVKKILKKNSRMMFNLLAMLSESRPVLLTSYLRHLTSEGANKGKGPHFT